MIGRLLAVGRAAIGTRVTAEREARRRAIDAVRNASDRKVLAGPFEEMAYGVEAIGSELAPKLAGTYELELHPWIEHIIATPYRTIHDIGCAEGYYAVGLALRMPDAHVCAYDSDPAARRAVAILAAMNTATDRVIIEAAFDSHALQRHHAGPCLVICDIEGAERHLLDPMTIPALLDTDLLVEVHDGAHDAAIERVLRDRFAATHHIDRLTYRGRTAADAPSLLRRRCSDAEIERALDERRRLGLTWLFMTKRQGA
jgi:hypothetical protein